MVSRQSSLPISHAPWSLHTRPYVRFRYGTSTWIKGPYSNSCAKGGASPRAHSDKTPSKPWSLPILGLLDPRTATDTGARAPSFRVHPSAWTCVDPSRPKMAGRASAPRLAQIRPWSRRSRRAVHRKCRSQRILFFSSSAPEQWQLAPTASGGYSTCTTLFAFRYYGVPYGPLCCPSVRSAVFTCY